MKNSKDYTEYIHAYRMLDDYAITCSPWNKGQHDYGNGHMMNFTEAHTLQYIIEHPGLIISDVANYWGFTLCAASKIVSSLHTKGLIKKEKEEENHKNLHLTPTELGLECNRLHQEFDEEYYTESTKIENHNSGKQAARLPVFQLYKHISPSLQPEHFQCLSNGY